MKKIKVEKAVGMVLAHDITRIVPGKFKGVGFKKGHLVRPQDVPELLKIGKRHIFVLNLADNQVHEDDAALRIAKAVSGEKLRWTDPKEGKSNINSPTNGLLKVNPAGLLKINKMGNLIVATLKNNFPCRQDQTVAATRIIPLVISRPKIERLEAIARDYYPIIAVKPYRTLRVGAVVTGSEFYDGLAKDEFDSYVGRKIKEYGSRVVKKINVPDEPGAIADAIGECKRFGCDVIITTGGMSVDPDDVTRKGVRKLGAKIIVYGSPILPGAMFLYAFIDDTPILGLPACVYFHSSTIFELVFPRVLAGEQITKAEIAAMGHGGLCMNCDVCRFPVCPFGK
jgi:hypothetical protein